MILVAIGSNLPGSFASPASVVAAAMEALTRVPGLRRVACSGLYRSAPIPASAQPDFINAAVRLQGGADAGALLAALHAIEARFGRVRGVVDAARVLDLDLIDLGGLVRAGPNPVLPHPRAHLRAFVLRPIQEIAPRWRHPILGRTAGQMLAALADQPIVRLPDPSAGAERGAATVSARSVTRPVSSE